MPIQKLDERVIAQIAAGEVIERPSSVVKELLENALDAQATEIQIEVSGGGRRLISISDNGTGIPSEEVELAVTRHATSKLRTVDDLEHMSTLGFRGEALASIAAVSHLTLTTCHQSEQVGTEVYIEGAELRRLRAVGAPKGTVIRVENLFFNTPARLKFLKADSTEKRHITSVVMNYALAYPHVRFVLHIDGRETLHTHGTGAVADVLLNLFGIDEFRQMVEIPPLEAGDYGVQVRGYTSTPEFSRADRTRILLFVNGRAIQDSKIAYAVVQAYHTFLMNGRFPITLLLLQVPSQDVDVNVHPTKAEVRFRDAGAVFSAVQRAIRQAVVENAAPSTTIRGGVFSNNAPTPPQISTNLGDVISPQTQLNLGLSYQGAGQSARQRDLYPQRDSHPNTPTDPTAIPEGLGAPQKPRTLPILRVVGQIAAAYIITEGPAGMYMIDQHAAHERILYEQFMDAYRQADILRQQVLNAQTIQLSPLDARLIEEHLALLSTLGFELEPFGGSMFTVRAVPAMLADSNPQALIASIISDLENGNKPGEQAIEDRIVKRICKQVAVKAGQVLSLEEMQGLIRQLERCESPHTCPHGRPTILHMSADQLAREFGRLGSR